MVGEVKLSITRSWVQILSLPDERSNRETSRRIGFYSVYLVNLQGLPFILLYFIYDIGLSKMKSGITPRLIVVFMQLQFLELICSIFELSSLTNNHHIR